MTLQRLKNRPLQLCSTGYCTASWLMQTLEEKIERTWTGGPSLPQGSSRRSRRIDRVCVCVCVSCLSQGLKLKCTSLDFGYSGTAERTACSSSHFLPCFCQWEMRMMKTSPAASGDFSETKRAAISMDRCWVLRRQERVKAGGMRLRGYADSSGYHSTSTLSSGFMHVRGLCSARCRRGQ